MEPSQTKCNPSTPTSIKSACWGGGGDPQCKCDYFGESWTEKVENHTSHSPILISNGILDTVHSTLSFFYHEFLDRGIGDLVKLFTSRPPVLSSAGYAIRPLFFAPVLFFI